MSVKTRPNGVVGIRPLSTVGLNLESLSPNIRQYISEQVKVCEPDQIHVCDGSEKENQALLDKLQRDGRLQKLSKYDNW